MNFLLLLPQPPPNPEISAVKDLYVDTLLQVLKEAEAASEKSVQPSVLDIALACPHLAVQSSSSGAQSYQTTQSIIATVYKLVVLLSVKHNIDIQSATGVDVRVLPIAWSPQSSFNSAVCAPSYGPVLDLQSLAASQRPWQYAFGLENDQGEEFVRAFVAAKQAAANHHCHCHQPSNVHTQRASPSSDTKQHRHVAVGGTFDHLHTGHKLLLTMTAVALDQSGPHSIMTVGITGDELLRNKKYAEQIENWSDRQKSVQHFLEALLNLAPPDAAQPVSHEVNAPGPNGHAVNIQYPNGLQIRCVEIWDAFGPTITDKEISALVISAETRTGGKLVNDKRAQYGWPALDVLEVDVLDARETVGTLPQFFENKLSSTGIRKQLAAKTK